MQFPFSLEAFRLKKKVGPECHALHDLVFSRPYILAGSLIVCTLNFVITYNLLNFQPYYLLFYLVDWLTTLLGLAFFAYGIRYLDRNWPLEKDLIKRMKMQLLFLSLAVLLVNILLNEGLDHLFFAGERLSLSFEFYTQDLLVALLFILIYQTIYLGLFFWGQSKNPSSISQRVSRLKINTYTGVKFIYVEDIQCIFTQNSSTYLMDVSGRRYALTKPLKHYETLLPQQLFRANRQFLLAKPIISEIRNATYGKLEILLKQNLSQNQLPSTLMVSREKAASFRKWLEF